MKSRARAAILLLSVSLIGCGDDPQGRPEPAASNSGAVDGPNLGGKLANAANSIAGASAKPMTADQPPPTGIFDEGLADKAFALNAPPKLDLISEGSDPKIQLLAGPFEEVQSIAMKVELEGALPALIAELEIGPPKAGAPAPEPGQDKKGEKGAKPAPKPGASASPEASLPAAQPLMPKPAGDYPLVATVKKLRVAAAGNEKEAAKLQVLLDLMNGSTIAFTMTKTGPKSFSRALLRKPEGEAGQILDLELSAIEEGLSVLYAPAPDKPVGEGASWVVTDRRVSFGSDAIRYRHFQLKRVQGDAAGIQVTLRQYATSDKSAFVPPPNVMDQYAAKADGALQIIPKRHFPTGGALHFEMQSMIVPEEAKNNPRAQHTKFGLELSVEMGQVQVVKPGEQPDGAPPPKGSGGGGKAPTPQKAPPPSP